MDLIEFTEEDMKQRYLTRQYHIFDIEGVIVGDHTVIKQVCEKYE